MDITEAIKEAIKEDLDCYDFATAVRHGVSEAMPFGEQILGSIYSGVHDAVAEAIRSGGIKITVQR